MVRDAQNAENQAKQAIAEAEASARQRAESAQKQAEAAVLTKQNELRAALAKLEGEAKAIENEAVIAAETARAEAEQELQGLRADVERLRLECDVFLPAEADRMSAEADARAKAAPVMESGKAAADALRLLTEQWKAAGADGRDLYALSHIRELVDAAVLRVANTQIAELNVVDGGNATSFTGAVASFPAAVVAVLEQTGKAIGVDLLALIQGARREGGRS
jgi:flotillin